MDEHADRPSYESAPPSARPGPTTHKYGALQRLWLAFTSPGEVFADIRLKPTWVACLVALVVLGIGVQLVVAPHIDAEATLRARLGDRADELSDEQIGDIVERGERFARFAPLIGVVVSPIALAVMAAVFFLMLKIVGSDADFAQAFSSTLHSYWPPSLVQAVLTAILIQRFDALPQQELHTVVKSHLGALLSPDAPAWLASAANTISVFNIWTVVLLVLGFAIVGSLPRTKAAIAALVPWGVWLLAKAGLGALTG